jgi:perosamine synthetase
MTDNFRSCEGLGLSPVRFLAGLFSRSSSLPDDFGLPEGEVVYTFQGRYAVQLICRLLNIGEGDEILAPAYNCGAEIDPFVKAGAKVVFYRVDESAGIDAQDIKRRLTPSTRIVYVSHFFGWPQDLGDLAAWCREKGLFLVEDCALCLFSQGPSRTIGRMGDAAVYSFVKSLAVPDGGALVLRDNSISNPKASSRKGRLRFILLSGLPLFKKWFMNGNRTWQRREMTRNWFTKSWRSGSSAPDTTIEREMPKSNYFDGHKIGWPMSRLSRGLLSKIDSPGIVEKRRRNYRRLLDALRGNPSLQLLYGELPDGVCPLSFPIFVKGREAWSAALEGRGILVGGWPSYHRGFDWKDYPEARRLKNDLLTLPVHQDLGPDQMDYIAACVAAVAEEHDHHHGR